MRYLIAFSIAAALSLSASQASANPDRKAREHFSEGLALYKSEDFAGAAKEFGLSHELRKDQTTLFAWAQALRLNGDCEKSKTRLKQYIANGANAKQSKAAFDLMDKCTPPAVEPIADPVVADPTNNNRVADPIVGGVDPKAGGSGGNLQGQQASATKHWYRDWLGVTLLSVGGVSLGASLFSYNAARSKESAATKKGVLYDEWFSLRSDAEEFRTNAVAFGVASGLLLSGAAAYILIDRFKGSSEESAASAGMAFEFDGHAGRVSFAGSF